MILNDKTIVSMAESLGVKPENVGPSSVDLCLGSQIVERYATPIEKVSTSQVPISSYKQIERTYNLEVGETFTFKPNRLYLCHTQETVAMPDNVAATLLLRSSLGRRGLNHSLAGYFDAGFFGTAVLELHTVGNLQVDVKIGDRICQLIYFKLNESAQNPYQGKYQNQKGAQGAIDD